MKISQIPDIPWRNIGFADLSQKLWSAISETACALGAQTENATP